MFYIELNLNGVAKTYRVHRLVAMTYIPNPEDKTTVNHINGIKSDNRVENLEWATVSENTQHAYDMGLLKPPKATEYIIENNSDSIEVGSYVEIESVTGYSSSQVTHYIKSGQRFKRGKYKGYTIRKIS